MIQILTAQTTDQLDQVRDLFRSFIKWHRQAHIEDLQLINEYFDEKEFEQELALLPWKYSKPRGSLLLALFDRQPAGCVALREIDSTTCEMKRMFIYEQYHGKGLGRALAEKIIEEARIIGYSTMKLDTSFRQIEAQALYKKMGFQNTKPYYPLPKKLEDWLVFMELKL